MAEEQSLNLYAQSLYLVVKGSANMWRSAPFRPLGALLYAGIWIQVSENSPSRQPGE